MPKRKLAAIMFSDIVGYTSLMNRDEKQAFDFIKKNRRIHWRLIRKYKGRLLKEMGDGMLASFPSSIDAVKCGLAIQKAVKELDIPLRIGIHQGDVIFEKRDVLGDGVNIASRIQGIAKTNGIAISESIFRDIKNKDSLRVESLGLQTLKGVEIPIQAYALECHDYSFLDFTIDSGELIRPIRISRIPLVAWVIVLALLMFAGYYFSTSWFSNNDTISEKSIIVLPFDNYTGTDTLDYFIAGMHNSLIGDIGKVSALRVISQTTANAYRDAQKSIPEIAAELGINTVIEAAVTCLQDSVCLQVKVLSTYPEEKQIWVGDYYEEKSQILNLYNTITREISEKINVMLTPQELGYLTNARTVDPEAYDAFMKGQYYWEQLNPVTLMQAMEYFQKAIDIDPTWAAPYTGMGMVWGVLGGFEFIAPDSAVSIQEQYLDQAYNLDPNSANTHYVKALMAIWGKWDWEVAKKEFLKSLELNPSDALCHMYYAHYLMTFHRFDEAVEAAREGLELDPLRPLVLGLFAVVMNKVGEYQSAIEHAEKAISIDPENRFASTPLQTAYMRTSQYEKWFENWKRMSVWEEEDIAVVEQAFREQGFQAAINAIVARNERVFSSGGQISINGQAGNYLILGEFDKAMDYLELAYEKRLMILPYISLYPLAYPELKENQRFIALLEKMGLPLL